MIIQCAILMTISALLMIGGVHGLPVIMNNNVFETDYKEHVFGISQFGRQGSKEGYGDPNSWPSLYPTCGGSSQSPINIDPKKAKNGNFPLFTFGNYDQQLNTWKLTNTGNTALYSLQSSTSSDKIPYMKDGGLSDRYNFAQFHFHWGGNGTDSTKLGSEHELRSRLFPAELHLVHYNSKYETLANAVTNKDGLAVLGIFIQVGTNDNSAFQILLDLANAVDETDDEANLKSALALNAVLPKRTSSFFRYSGSLTTPKCNEIVTWTVFDDPLVISQSQLTKLRSLLGEAGKVENYRPVQPINDRTIYFRSNLGDRCHLPTGWPLTPTALTDFIWWTGCLSGLF